MTAHDAPTTPGPWKCKRSATGSWLIVPEDYPSFKICRIENAITYIMDFDDAAEADARLIASAPALAEENARLREALALLVADIDTCGRTVDQAYLNFARAALARKEPEA